MNIVVIDAQGGGFGKQFIQALREKNKEVEIIAVGTNSIATTSMLKAGANHGATGENAVLVNCKRADIIVGPIGILLTNSLYGEVTGKMVEAVSYSGAKRVLIPFLHEDNIIVGVVDYNMKHLISLAVQEVEKML